MDRVALERAARADARPVSTLARKIIVEWLRTQKAAEASKLSTGSRDAGPSGTETIMKTLMAALLAVALTGGAASANASECSYAVNNYNSNMNEMLSTVVRLHRCVANSRGTDDCSSEFRRVRSEHSDFESAVSNYQSSCR
jgi:hypothetical protein